MIRPATIEDLDTMMAIFDLARQFMIEQGNPTQWDANYPNADLVADDIAQGHAYVIEREGSVVGAFAFIIGEDETYQLIEEGDWHSYQPYGTIHRLASNGQAKGLARECFDFCRLQISYLRIDTHVDNQAMQAAIRHYGFEECGLIYVADGSPRLAFDYLAD